MAEQPDSYEDLTQCGLDDDNEAELLQIQRECTFMWTNKKGEAFGAVSYTHLTLPTNREV